MDHSEPCDPSSSSSSSVNGELRSICKKAKQLLCSREYDKADSLMKDANLALLRINSVIQLFKSESLEEDPKAKNLCIQEALFCAYRATQLSPSNLEFSFFYVKLLISYCQRYEEGIEECERSLAVTNPISDAADYLRELNFQEASHVTTEEGWIIYYREQLRSFLIIARDALIDRSLPERRQDQELYNSSCPVCREVLDTSERALVLLDSNNFTKADRLLQQANYRRHISFAFFHRIRALVHYYGHAYTHDDDPEAKEQRFHEAIASARRATQLSPSNLEYSLFYVNLLICCSERFPEAVNECERALAVTEPINFFFENFLEETTENQMAFYQQSLRFILRAHSVGPITDTKENCPASCSSSSLASTSTDPPSDEVKSLNDQAQGDKHCPANSIASFPPDNVKDLTDKALPSSHQGEEPCPSHSSTSSLVSTSTNPHPPDDEVKILCRQAIQFLSQRDPIGAHDTLNNVRHQHESSSLFHYTYSIVLRNYFKTLTNDPEGRKSKLQEAIDSAHQATILSPNILEFSFHYVRLLVLHSKFEEAAKECERAFVIINNYDFLPQGYGDKTGLEISATEVNHYQKRFHFLSNMLKSPIASAHCKVMLAEKEQAYRIPSCLEYLWRDLIRVNVNDFKKWSEQNSQFLHIITAALEFFQEKHTWKFWICPRCPGKRFEYLESKMQHVLKEHTEKLSEELKPFFPEKYDQDWVVKLVNNIVDAKITKNLDTSKPLKLNLEKTRDSYTLEFLSPLLKSYMQNVNSDWVHKIVSCTWEPIDVQAMTGDSNRLPLSHDPERKELLKRIQDYFRILILHNYLLKNHLDRVLRYAMKELQALSSAELLLSHGVNNQSVDCIRVLDSLQLQKVLEVLQTLTQDRKLEPYAEPHDPSSNVVFNIPECDVRIRAFFYDSWSHIDLDLKILSSSKDTSSPDNGTKCFPDVNSMLFWLYEHNLMQIINGWSHQRNKGPMEADRLLKKLEKEIEDLTSICTVKGELLTYLVHIEHLKGICEKELMERENSVEVIMTKWKEELAERAETGNDFVIRVISAILTEAEAFRASQDGDDAINNDENHPKTSSLDNFFIKAAFRKLEESYDKKICIVDGKIMKNLATARQLQLNLERTCAIDFLVVLLPLLKTYIQEVVMKKVAEQTIREPGASGAVYLMKLLHTVENSTDKREEKEIQEISKGIKKSKSNKPKKSKGRKFR